MASSRPSPTGTPDRRKGLTEALLRRDRQVVLAGLGAISLLAWTYMVQIMGGMSAGHAMEMPHWHGWTAAEAGLTFLMWTAMMVAMMTPSAAPTILAYVHLRRGNGPDASPYAPTGEFLAGYLLVWTAFSAFATLWQWDLHSMELLSDRAASASPYLSGGLLLLAGLYQWTPIKGACLKHCRSPLGFLMRSWRDGRWGAFRMGMHHGIYCVACCWPLMLLMFVLGAMNVLWMAALTAFIVLEKAAPGRYRVGQAIGLLLTAWGAVTLALAL